MANTNFVDKAGITYVVGKIKELLGGKVDKADGKGLSTNDYTTAEKTKRTGMQHLEERLSKISRLPFLPRILQAHTRQTGRLR